MNWNNPLRFLAGPLAGVRLKCDRGATLKVSPDIHISRNVYIHAQGTAVIEIVGSGYIDEGTRIVARDESSIYLGPGLWTQPHATIYAERKGKLWSESKLFLGRSAEISCKHSIQLGGRNAFAAVCHVIDSDHGTERDKPLGHTQLHGPIVFSADTLCGAHVVVTRGVTVGEGAVVGANAVVTRDIPPFEIWGGVPARKLKDRE